MSYEVDAGVFNGPFDLLLHLILAEEVDLYEISLTTIIDAYLVELDRMERCNLEVATEFLLIAATLVELKARRLLPDNDDIDLDDELALFEERDLLLARLVECKTFKDAARVLRHLGESAGRSYPRQAGVEEQFLGVAPDMLEGIGVDDLRAACIRALTPRPEPVLDLYHLGAVTASVDDAVRELIEELPGAGTIVFRQLTSGLVDRIEVVVRFLAVLELFKQGMVDIVQARAFGDIELEWVGGDPREARDSILIDRYEG
ncbi:MAG: segregation and condensation protein A [Acidimicrobiales bacterium]